MTTRRELLSILGAGALSVPLAAVAQPKAGVTARIGVLGAGSLSGWVPMVEALKAGLRERGYVEGKNIHLEYRWADGNYERLPDLAAELLAARVDVIVTHARAGIRAAKQATASTPIVMASIGDPVAAGLIANLSRPGGNITGLSFFSQEITAKRLELLRETLPHTATIAVLMDRSTIEPADIQVRESAAKALKIAIQVVDVKSVSELENKISAIAKNRRAGLSVSETPMLISNGKTVGALATKHRLASIGFSAVAEGGGLMSYGADIPAMWHRAATYVDKISNGTKPGDIPVEQPTKFEMVVNLKPAKTLGITIPPSVMVRATRVIE